jgi:hypothetical protein
MSSHFWTIGDYIELSFLDAGVSPGIGILKRFGASEEGLTLTMEIALPPNPCPRGYELGSTIYWRSNYCLRLDPDVAREEIVRRTIKDLVI